MFIKGEFHLPVGLPTCAPNLCWPDWYLVLVRPPMANTLLIDTFSLSCAFGEDSHFQLIGRQRQRVSVALP